MDFTDNPVYDADRYNFLMEMKLERLPKCSYCGQPIQDEYHFYIEQNNKDIHICNSCELEYSDDVVALIRDDYLIPTEGIE